MMPAASLTGFEPCQRCAPLSLRSASDSNEVVLPGFAASVEEIFDLGFDHDKSEAT